jgi:multiple sugar transport system ATP-binding protein
MDEPLSNLDAKLREALRVELEHMQKTQESTTLFVTHDQIEALTMADRLAVLQSGRVVQIGTPVDIYDRPATVFVAELVGTPRINLLRARRENGSLRVLDSTMQVPAPDGHAIPPGVLLGVRPEDIYLDTSGSHLGRVSLIEPLGAETILYIKAGEQTLLSMIPGITSLHIGDEVRFSVTPERLHYFGEDGRRIVPGRL